MPDPYKTSTPGLLVTRRYSHWYVLHEPSGNLISFSSVGRFDRMRDAKAAAGRLSEVSLDWTSERPFADLAGLGQEYADEIRESIHDALTGTTAEERRRKAQEARERKEWERQGGGRRDHAERAAEGSGHELTWSRYGSRSWKATCVRCGRGLRLPWSSVQRRYDKAYGDVLQEGCSE